MKSTGGFALSLLVTICLLQTVALASESQQQNVNGARLKRQAVANVQTGGSVRNKPSAAAFANSDSPSVTSFSSASASSQSTSSSTETNISPIAGEEDIPLSSGPKRVSSPKKEVKEEATVGVPVRTTRRPKHRRGPRPERRRHQEMDEEDEGDEDCDDYDGHEHVNYQFVRPMRQFSRMMGDMFDQMQGMASGEYDGFPGANMAVASASSYDDGDSRISTIVRKNGRTRGYVSETRNGRTQTRRIGDHDDQTDSGYEED